MDFLAAVAPVLLAMKAEYEGENRFSVLVDYIKTLIGICDRATDIHMSADNKVLIANVVLKIHWGRIDLSRDNYSCSDDIVRNFRRIIEKFTP